VAVYVRGWLFMAMVSGFLHVYLWDDRIGDVQLENDWEREDCEKAGGINYI
jgi:hypothetical protein